MGRGQASAQPCGAAEQPDSSSSQPPHVPGAVGGDGTCRTQVLFLSPRLPWGPSGNADRGHAGLTRGSEPSSAALSRTQPRAGLGVAPGTGTCDAASVTMSDALRKAVPVGSFSPRAGALVILCLFDSHHDTYVLHRV